MSSTRTFTLRNTGDAPLDVESAAITPPTPQFTLVSSETLPHTLNPGDEMDVDVTASSVGEGSFEAELEIIHTGVSSPSRAPISANFIPLPVGPGSIFKEASGTTHASFPALPSYVLGNYTIEFWQYIMSTPSPQNYGRLIDNNFSTGFAVNWQNDNKLANEGPGIGLISFNNAIILDTWQHYAIRRSGTVLDLIVNGVIVRTGTVSSTVLNISGRIYVGGPAETLQSFTSDLRMWTVARSDAEIIANYQIRLTGDEAGLVAYYPIFETNSEFEDFTGNNSILFLKTNTTDGEPAPGRLEYSANTPPCFP